MRWVKAKGHISKRTVVCYAAATRMDDNINKQTNKQKTKKIIYNGSYTLIRVTTKIKNTGDNRRNDKSQVWKGDINSQNNLDIHKIITKITPQHPSALQQQQAT